MTIVAAFAAILVIGLFSLALTLPSEFWPPNPGTEKIDPTRLSQARDEASISPSRRPYLLSDWMYVAISSAAERLSAICGIFGCGSSRK